MVDSSFKDDIRVDKYNLDWELERQGELYYKWARKRAVAAADRHRKEERLKIIKKRANAKFLAVVASLNRRIRENPANFGFKRVPGQGAIDQMIPEFDEYKDAYKEYLDAVEEATEELSEAINEEETMEAARMAMSHKRTSIEKEADLWITNYFSRPNVSKDAKDGFEKESVRKHRDHLTKTGRLKRRNNNK